MMHPYYDQSDPMGPYYSPYPEHAGKEADGVTPQVLWRVLLILAVQLAAMALLSLLTGCAVHKQEHEHLTHVVAADTMATEASQDSHSHRLTVDLDSIVSAVWQRTMDEFARQEQEHETVTETLTETIDSLGRIVRQSQKTTDRTLSRLEQQRIERLEQTVSEQIHRAISEHDSLWQQRFAHYQLTMSDSLDLIRNREVQRAAASPVNLWQQARIWLGNLVLVALAVLAALIIFRKKILWHIIRK